MMRIGKGTIVVLINQSGSAKDLADSMIEKFKANIVEVYTRKVELMVPESMSFNEVIANQLIEKNGYEVTQMVSSEGRLHIFYAQDDFRAANHRTNANIANTFG